jgi:cysteine desulfurase/selenocysteine lyase
MSLDVSAIRREFPILTQTIGGHPLVYLDSAATAQKPEAVLDAMNAFYEHDNGNAHRSMHILAERATLALENARKAVQRFLRAARPEEIVFTKSCTEGINLVARSFGATLQRGDAIVLTVLEHHSNIVPWLQLKEERGVELRWVDVDDRGRLKMEEFERALADKRVKLVAVTGQSNVLGVRPPLGEMIKRAHGSGALVLIDAAQLIGHHQVDVSALDCDFLAFSGHKLYGPTGIGVLYGKEKHLRAMPPFLGGGQMIQEVHQDHFTAADIPAKFEAGTMPLAEAAGLHAAIDWLEQCDWSDIEAHERTLLEAALEELAKIPGVRVLGSANAAEISGCVSFATDGIHPHDLTEILGRRGICLRAGHHCTQPLHRRLGITASTRLSVGIYNTVNEIRAACAAMRDVLSSWK